MTDTTDQDDMTTLLAYVETHYAHGSPTRKLADEVARLREEHAAFRRQVRRVAIRTAEEEDWCDPGLNDVLRELGLPKHDGSSTALPFIGTLTARGALTTTAEYSPVELQRWCRVGTNDTDVEVLESRMAGVDDTHVTANVRFQVRGTTDPETAAEWALAALYLHNPTSPRPYRRWFRATECSDLRWEQQPYDD